VRLRTDAESVSVYKCIFAIGIRTARVSAVANDVIAERSCKPYAFRHPFHDGNLA